MNTSEEATSGISVSGMGEVTGTPDTVEVGLGVSVLGETVDQAATTAAEKAQALIDSLTANGVAEEDITTTDYSIYPEYDYSSNEERLIGYRVSNTVRAKIRDLDSTGAVLDAATAAGGDDVVVNGLSFSIEDNDELVAAAREAAWNDAMTKANQLAELSGQTLGEATTITETVSMPPTPIPYAAEAAADRAVETPIEPGYIGGDHHPPGPVRTHRLSNRLHRRSNLEVIMGITVSGAGEANAAPDIVEVDVGVSVIADTVQDATRVAAERAEAVSSALTAGGVTAADIATTEYSIRPEYDYSDNKQRLLGYRVSNTVRAKLRDIASTGPLLDSIASAGGDETRVNGLSFGVADETSLLARAREAAWDDARVKAEQLAALSGHTLGKATSITETVQGPVLPMPRMMAADMAMSERASTPIQPGTSAVTVTLLVEFGFRE